MPINYKLYPANWPQIRTEILERDGHKCKFCGLPNRLSGVRLPDGSFSPFHSCAEAFAASEAYDAGDGPRRMRIVLTVAHLADPDPLNCDPENLAALCQRCHLNHDRAMVQMRRKERLGQLRLAALDPIAKQNEENR